MWREMTSQNLPELIPLPIAWNRGGLQRQNFGILYWTLKELLKLKRLLEIVLKN